MNEKKNIIEVIKDNKKKIIKSTIIIGCTAVGLAIGAVVYTKMGAAHEIEGLEILEALSNAEEVVL